MDEELRKALREMTGTLATMMSDWFNQVAQRFGDDPVISELWSARMAANNPVHSAGIDPYRVLGLNKTATDDQVKKRHRELLMKLHPDTAGTKGTEFLLQMVIAAYRQIAGERGW